MAGNASTENFTVFAAAVSADANAVAKRCETVLSHLRKKWTDDDAPILWNPPCQVVLHARSESYLAAVGREGGQTVGSSLVRLSGGRVVGRRIDLLVRDPFRADAALAHELTHLIVNDHFAARQPPHWVDEGMAILADSEAKRVLHRRDLELALAGGTAFRLAELLSMESYPPSGRRGAFYGQSASLVEFLVEHSGPAIFVRFVERGIDAGYERALIETYGIQSLNELEQLWLEQLAVPTLSASR